jgi:N-formylglutamate deformylase
MKVFELSKAESPLVISVPHDGALIPDDILATMNPMVLGSTDRDYLIGEVFDFVGMSYSKIKANYSRHVIDLNRPATGEALYQGQTETELCPTSTFDCKEIYLVGQQPDQAEILRRMELYWQPYHKQLTQLIDLAKNKFGFCLLIDAHSIDDEVPRFFQGRLPDINVGTFNGRSCASTVEAELLNKLKQQNDFSHVINGRFKGGFITRNYGNPDGNIHAIQLEHAKSCYLNQQQKLSGKAEKLRGFWQETLQALKESVNAA